MTSKERMLIAMTNGKPDRVPCAPDMSTMIPQKLTGKPFWQIELYGDPPLWKAYMDAARYFGIDAWFIYGGLDFHMNSEVQYDSRILSETDTRIVREVVYHTPAGDMHSESTFYIADSCTLTEKPVKSIVDDFEKVKYLYPEITGYSKDTFEAMRAEVGDDGAFGATLVYPGFQTWIGLVHTSVEELTFAYYDHPEIIEEWRVMEDNRTMRMVEMTIEAKPDFILFGGSGSITLQSPAIFRELCLPTLKKATRMCKEAGIPTMIHSCGKERALVEMMATETDLNCVNPLEVPPMGDCDLAEVKASFGHKLSFMGNLHTTDVMLYGTPDDVEKAAIKAIDDAGANGGFILSTGDQCGRDTPEENIRRMVEVCKSYGQY